MQNLARFWTTSNFGGEYLRNGWRYSKSDKYFIYRASSRVRRNKSGELWSSNLGDLDVKLYPPKTPYSAPRGCCAPKFLHALENGQVLLAHPPRGTGTLLHFLNGVQNWLNIQHMSLKIFGARGCSPTKLCYVTCRYVGVITPIQLLKFGTAKIVQN